MPSAQPLNHTLPRLSFSAAHTHTIARPRAVAKPYSLRLGTHAYSIYWHWHWHDEHATECQVPQDHVQARRQQLPRRRRLGRRRRRGPEDEPS